MARSRKKTPIGGNAIARSEKYDKQKANRKLRRSVREAVAAEAEVLPLLRQVSDTWTFNKDGKQWFGDRHPAELRK